MEGRTLEQRVDRMEVLLECLIDTLKIPLPPEMRNSEVEAEVQEKYIEFKKQHNLEKVVTDLIHELGVPAHLKGYHYMRTAVMICVEDIDNINYITKRLYPNIAKQYRTTSSRVERAIRHSIEVSWIRGNQEIHNQIFGYSVDSNKGKPTNSEFIAMVADKIRFQMK